MASVTRLTGAAFGAELHGVDLSGGVDDATLALLTSSLYAHRVLVVRGQHFDEAQYLRFGRAWGEPIPHVLDHMRMAGFPELMTIGNTERRDRDARIRNGAALWHTDQSYEAVPASATMLYSIRAPRHGGETQFCDMAAAYAALDDARKPWLETLQIAHKYGRGVRRPGEMDVNPIRNDEQDTRVPVVYHPLVLRHPITGHPALYALGHGAHAVRGLPAAEGEALIAELKEHALQERFIYRHHYTVGDVVIWDTLQTMHCATPIAYAGDDADAADGLGEATAAAPVEPRLLWRVSVRGRPRIHAAG